MLRIKFSIFQVFLALIITNVILLSLGIFFYPEKFLFWQYPFSYIGALKSVNGLNNFLSSIIYSLNMIINAFLILFLSFIYRYQKIFLLSKIMLLSSAGFLISAFCPDDTKHELHMIGSALAVASLWLMANYYFFINKDKLKSKGIYLLQGLFHFSFIIYALTVFLDLNPIDGLWQKISFFILGFVLLYFSYHSQENLRS